MYNIHQLVKKIREESGMTQAEFAESLSVSKVLISMVETGQKDVSKKLIKLLANKLEVHPNSLTPFIFDKTLGGEKLSPIEEKMIKIGESLQLFLIKTKAKNLKQDAKEKKQISKNQDWKQK